MGSEAKPRASGPDILSSCCRSAQPVLAVTHMPLAIKRNQPCP